MESSLSELNQQILDAHAKNDKHALATLYHAAANSFGDNNIDEACFFLTQAYVFALELGLDTAGELHRLLVLYNREK